MRVGIVVQRYGKDIIGGAEAFAREIAENLASGLGWQVEVFTTTAKDYRTWANYYPEGKEIINGLTVTRFPVRFERQNILLWLIKLKLRVWGWILNWLPWLRFFVENLWIIFQGPYSPALISALKKESPRFDCFIFFTYLYYPTLKGIQIAPEKSFLVPTSHDEAPFYFLLVKNLFSLTKGILVNNKEEKSLVERIYPEVKDKIKICGMGVDFKKYEEIKNKEKIINKYVGKNSRYIIFLGRVSKGKNIDFLVAGFRQYLEKTKTSDLSLLLVGQNEGFTFGEGSKIILTDPVSEEEKIALISGAECLVNPSPYESLSIIVVEALTLKKPVLVNGQCEVLMRYARETKTVFSYFTKTDFVETLAKTLDSNWTSDPKCLEELQQSKKWAEDNFSWPIIIDKYKKYVHRLN